MNVRTAAPRGLIARDDWLSAQLGRSVWRVQPDSDPVAAVTQAGPAPGMFFTRLPTGEVAAVTRFEDAGFRVVDTTLTFEAAAANIRTRGAARLAKATDRDSVGRIAEHSFEWSRLHLDPLLPNVVANRSRRNWALNYFDGARGDKMIVADGQNGPAAFLLAIGPSDGVAVIDLIAVDAGARRQGLGAACVGFLASINGVDWLRVGTQAANIASVRFYEKLGFRLVASHYVLHMHRA